MKEKNECDGAKTDVLKRLNRIEGQVKGIRRMLEEEKNCVDILTQVSAVRSAINKVGAMILEKYSEECITCSRDPEEQEKKVKELLDTVQKFLNFVD